MIKFECYLFAGADLNCLKHQRKVSVSSRTSDSFYPIEVAIKVGTTFNHSKKGLARVDGRHTSIPATFLDLSRLRPSETLSKKFDSVLRVVAKNVEDFLGIRPADMSN